MSAITSSPAAERRREPRVPVAIPAWVDAGGTRCAGHVIDASTRGLLVELREPPLFAGSRVSLTLAMPGRAPRQIEGTVARRSAGDGRAHLAVRLDVPLALSVADAAGPDQQVPCPSGRRPRGVAEAELCALGTAALELTLLGPDRPVPPSLTGWLDQLASELGGDSPDPASSADELLRLVSALASER